MSQRNPFVSEVLHAATEAQAAEVVDAIRVALDCQNVTLGAGYIHGLHTASWPGALPGEALDALTYELTVRGITSPLALVFAGDGPEDRVRYVYDGEAGRVERLA